MHWTKRKLILSYTIYTLITIIVVCLNLKTDKMLITESAKNAFMNAINQEKHLYISQIHMRYHRKDSHNDISGEEKKNWCEQVYFIATDSNRYNLDSLFRNEMRKININTTTAIGYTYKGKKYNSRSEKFIEDATLVQEYKYRKDYHGTSDITLQAYIHTPSYLLILNNICTCILLIVFFFSIVGCLYLRRRKKRGYSENKMETNEANINNENVSYVQRKYKSTKWIQIYEGYFLDYHHNTLRHNNKSIILSGKAIRIFREFLAKEDFFLSHTDICKLYNQKFELPETKDRIYHSIKSLKECIAALDINIISVRGEGYRLVFNAKDCLS